MTSVVSVSALVKSNPQWQSDPQYVYIGRNAQYGDNRWGNPFVVGTHGTREQVIEAYEAYLLERMGQDPTLATHVRELSGKTLVCHCAPQGCHGDVLARYADWLNASWSEMESVWASMETQAEFEQRMKALLVKNKEEQNYISLLCKFAQSKCAETVKDEASFWEWRHQYLDPIFDRDRYGAGGKYGRRAA